jgi:thiazole synthase
LASRTQQKPLSLSSTPGGYDEDLSGGVFFNGPTDFRPDANSPDPASLSQIQLQGKGEQKPKQKKSSNTRSRRSKPNPVNTIPKDIVIIGAGLAGVAAALHISLNSDRQVTIIDKEDPFQQMEGTTAGSFAAAGMLAPQSERLPSGPLLDLCLESRDMYTDFVQMIEGITANCGEEAQKYLYSKNVPGSDLEPWEVGYAATGGFLAPAFAGDSVATWSPPAEISGTAKWLDDIQVHEMEPCLHPDVIGGWWFPEDASVDARRLICGMRAACVDRGIQFMWGDSCGANSLELIGKWMFI